MSQERIVEIFLTWVWDGAFLEVMKTAGWLVKGLEPDENARKIAETRGVDVSSTNSFFIFRKTLLM
jgi:hypothetical protein